MLGVTLPNRASNGEAGGSYASPGPPRCSPEMEPECSFAASEAPCSNPHTVHQAYSTAPHPPCSTALSDILWEFLDMHNMLLL